MVFLKPNSALVPNGAAIVVPPCSEQVHHEIELAVIIGQGGRRIAKDRALEHVLGYAIILDITARDIQTNLKSQSLPWTLSKGWDTFAPISEVTPAAAIEDPHDLDLQLMVSGQVRQKANTRDMRLSIGEIIAFASDFITLQRGDIIATGTPEVVGPLVAGDRTVAEIQELGVLENCVSCQT